MKIPSMFRPLKRVEERIPTTLPEAEETPKVLPLRPLTIADDLGLDVEDAIVLMKMPVRDLIAHIVSSLSTDEFGSPVYCHVEDRLNPLGINFSYVLNKDLEYDKSDGQLYIINTMSLLCISELGFYHMHVDLTSFQLSMSELPRRTENTTLGQSIIVRYYDELCNRANINNRCDKEMADRIKHFIEISKKSVKK